MSAQLLVAPVIGIPVAGLIWYNGNQARPEDRVSKSYLLTTWIVSGFLGPTIGGAGQFAMAWPLGKLVLGDEFDNFLKEFGRSENEVKLLDSGAIAIRKAMAFSMPNIVAGLFLSTLAPATEEIFKYAALKVMQRYFPSKLKTKRNYIVTAMAIGLGFALVENLAFIASATPNETQRQLAITIIERGIFGTSGHFLTAALTGCKFAETQTYSASSRSMWATIKESLLYHCLGNFSLFAISTLYGNVGFIHPRDVAGVTAMLACVIGVNAMAALRVGQEIGKIDRASIRKAS